MDYKYEFIRLLDVARQAVKAINFEKRELVSFAEMQVLKNAIDFYTDEILKNINDINQCNCSWDYVTGESPTYFCGKCGRPMHN